MTTPLIDELEVLLELWRKREKDFISDNNLFGDGAACSYGAAAEDLEALIARHRAEHPADGWRPIKEAPAGHCLMVVRGVGYRGEDQIVFGKVYRAPEGKLYFPTGYSSDSRVTHFMPIPAIPADGWEG